MTEETASNNITPEEEEFSFNLDDKVDINITQLLLLIVKSEEEAMQHVYYDDETKEMGTTADTMVIARRNLLEFMERQKSKGKDGENVA